MEALEKALRSKLGIPLDAERVLLFTESSHWDPDWMLTSKQYFALRVKGHLDKAVKGLVQEPRRVYSAECAFYVRMYWEHRPALQGTLKDLLDSGRLRLMGSGVTTPDTIIPSTESLVRDYLVGQEWYRSIGVTVEPEVAYFPDSFGHGPALPTVLRSVGITAAALCRVDGMYFFGCESELPGSFPKAGSSAELLSKKEGTQDFVWRSPDGNEILAHWVAYGYGHGELLAHAGVTRMAGAPLAVPARGESHVASRIAKYAAQLSRYARTPYMCCPIGFDFSPPISRLVELLDRYNERRYLDTGVWVLNAGLDDYFSLVDCHRSKLPVIDFDPNPYFSGFYTSRTTIKKRCRELSDALMSTEARAVSTGDPSEIRRVAGELEDPWWTSTTSNHHDFVTGTAPDRVVRREQIPWLDEALVAVEKTASSLPVLPTRARPSPSGRSLSWSRHDSLIEVTGAFGRMVLDEERGGCITALESPEGEALLGAGPCFDVATYVDWGGLWRMGHEYLGGRYRPSALCSSKPVALAVSEVEGGFEITSSCDLDGSILSRWIRVDDDPSSFAGLRLRFNAHYRIPVDRTVTALVPLAATCGRIVTDVPGGVIERGAVKISDPTYWSVQSFAYLPSGEGPGVALMLAFPGAVALRPEKSSGLRSSSTFAGRGEGAVAEIVLGRNAPKERFLGFLPMPGFPARGHDPGPHSIDFSLLFTKRGDWRDNRLVSRARDFARDVKEREGASGPYPDEIVETDDDEILVIASKPASRGDGIVVRLFSTAKGERKVRIRLAGRPLEEARLCDGRERDLASAGVEGEFALLDLKPGIASVRLLPVS